MWWAVVGKFWIHRSVPLCRHRPAFPVLVFAKHLLANFRFGWVPPDVKADEAHADGPHHSILLFVASSLPLSIMGWIVKFDSGDNRKIPAAYNVVK
ncbi:hypothetical protein PSO31014_04419 [Pandoraea soli]|uniref:Uncharacterized protein n=1 Tax=Pandoraea soli TaxID=2508293 RepID=A0ABY6WAL5_9BURK|nr:hypothetical protein PSO31014_04419 [Pandoraea soli]